MEFLSHTVVQALAGLLVVAAAHILVIRWFRRL
jgi:hypothetical protein